MLCLRTFRIFSFVQISRYPKKMLHIFYEAIIRLMILCVVLFLVIYVYAIIGSQFFAGKLKFQADGKTLDLANGYLHSDHWG